MKPPSTSPYYNLWIWFAPKHDLKEIVRIVGEMSGVKEK